MVPSCDGRRGGADPSPRVTDSRTFHFSLVYRPGFIGFNNLMLKPVNSSQVANRTLKKISGDSHFFPFLYFGANASELDL